MLDVPMLDVPIYGRIATLELFRPHGEPQDLLFISTERYMFCVLQWDADTSELITRAMRNVSDQIGRPTDNGQHEEGTIEELARDYNTNWMSAIEILDDNVFIGAENNYNIFTVCKNRDAKTPREERGRLEVVGEYHLGEFVNRFRHGSLRLPDSEGSNIPTLSFGTSNGVIGVIASLTHDQYVFFEKLQAKLVTVIKGVGGISHNQWRSFNNEKRTAVAKNFLNGDLIEFFLDLGRSQMDDIASLMEVKLEELCERVEKLTRLH